MHTVLEVLHLTANFLQQKGIENPRRQAEELLSQALGLKRMELYMEFDRPMTQPELDRSREWLKRRIQGEPLQYIAGEVEFFDCKIQLNRHVLIPRQETEILVDKIAKKLSKEASLTGKVLWDVCCGSGCIGVSLKKRFPELTVICSDLSAEAIEQARKNAQLNEVDVEFAQGNLLHPFAGKTCDYFVCNPPYIAENEYLGLDREVREFEPKMALISGETGLEIYQKLAEELPNFLNPGAKVWFEIGTGQGELIRDVFQGAHWSRSEVENDWSGHNRFFSLEIE